MASGDSRFEQQNQLDEKEEQRLKYLEFVHVAGIYTMMCFWSLYVYAKDKSGPLKPSVEAVESTVKTVVGPVYHKFHDFPIEVLKFVDRKMDESMNKLDHHVPPVVRQVSTKAYSAAQKAPELARNVASGVQRTSVVDTASGIAKSMYAKYEPVAEQYAVSAWCSFKKLPVFPQVAQVMAPTAAYCSEKYNRTVLSTAEKGYKVANLLPLVPTEKITEVFRTPEAEFHPLDAQQVDPTVAAH